MTKKEQIQKRSQEILELLRASDQEHPVPLTALMERFDASRRTIYDDIKALQESGFAVETLQKKGFFLAGETKQEEQALYRKSRVESLLDVMLMITIQLSEKPLTIDEILPLYARVCSYDAEDAGSLKSALVRKLRLLQAQGYLVEEDGRYGISLTAPVYLMLTERQIEELNDLILFYGQDVAHAKTLEGIAEQLRAVYEGGMLTEDRKYSGIGLHRIRGDEAQKAVERINRYPYDRKCLDLTYEVRDGELMHFPCFRTGLLIYTADKDRLYILGTQQGEEDGFIRILNVGKIREVRETEEKNEDFQSEAYMQMFHEMLVVDADPPEQVEVEISAGNPNLIRKFERHVRERNEGRETGETPARLVKKDENYIYTDTVRGIGELARFLRQYGWSVRVLGPESLKEKMLFTANRALERYGVLENEISTPEHEE